MQLKNHEIDQSFLKLQMFDMQVHESVILSKHQDHHCSSIELDKDIQEPRLWFNILFYKRIHEHTGIRNASVFPEPVIAAPRISWPCNATPIASRWMSVGVLKSALTRPEIDSNK